MKGRLKCHVANVGRAQNAPHNVRVLELLEQRNLANGRRRDALVLRLETNLFERQDLASHAVFGLVHLGCASAYGEEKCRGSEQ